MRAPLAAGRTRPGDPLSTWAELAAALATAAVVAQVLFVPTTLVIAVALIAVGRTSRWRPQWLLLPGLAGLGWLLANGAALTAFAALPHRLGVTPELAHGLPSALLLGSAEAALALWLVWYPLAWRPGLMAVLHRRASGSALSAGHTVAPGGFALGIVTGTGKPVTVTWAEAERGVLITGHNEVRLAELGRAAACAAMRLRKTVLIVDLSGFAAPATVGLAKSLGVPQSEDGRAVRNRSVAVVGAGQAVAALESLRTHGLRADCLIWVSGGQQLAAACLDSLLELGPATGTALIFTSTSEAWAAALAPRLRVVAAEGPVSRNLALQLASLAPDVAGRRFPRRRLPAGRETVAASLVAQRSGEFTVLADGMAGSAGALPNCRLVPINAQQPRTTPEPALTMPEPTVPEPTVPELTGPGVPEPGLTGPTTAAWRGVPRGRIRADLIYLGWQPSQVDPGPPPTPPAALDLDDVNPDWVAAQRREQSRLSRPARLTALACLVLAGVDAACLLVSARLAVAAGLIVIGVAADAGRRIWQGERAFAAALREERQRVALFREVQLREIAARQQQYAHLHRTWQRRTVASWRQPQWRPVTLPAAVGRVDVAGGTLAGWSALLTTIAVPRLAAGGQVTVLDLTEGGVAADLIAVAGHLDIDPAVWVLPADLASLQLGADLSREVFADLLAMTVHAADGHADTAADSALIARVLAALGDGASMARILAALRALGQIGGADQHLGQVLSQTELTRLSTLAGRGAERLVVDRAWAIEARLRILGPLATTPPVHSQLKVAWLDRRAAAVGNTTLAAYLTVATTAVLRQAPPSKPWQQTIVLLGAERLPGDAVDRLCDATESAGAGLVLGYRSILPQVRERLGRGDAAVAFMRLGNAEEARFASEQIGTEHRLVLSQLTDTVGTSITETDGDSYTSTVGDTSSDSLTLTAGRSKRDGSSPFGSRDANVSTAMSVSDGISTGSSWGVSTSRAIGASDSLARTAQRSREFLVEQRELQQLPQSAVVLCTDGQVVLADANPAIMALPTATLATR